jgi:hypothetical protein
MAVQASGNERGKSGSQVEIGGGEEIFRTSFLGRHFSGSFAGSCLRSWMTSSVSFWINSSVLAWC